MLLGPRKVQMSLFPDVYCKSHNRIRGNHCPKIITNQCRPDKTNDQIKPHKHLRQQNEDTNSKASLSNHSILAFCIWGKLEYREEVYACLFTSDQTGPCQSDHAAARKKSFFLHPTPPSSIPQYQYDLIAEANHAMKATLGTPFFHFIHSPAVREKEVKAQGPRKKRRAMLEWSNKRRNEETSRICPSILEYIWYTCMKTRTRLQISFPTKPSIHPRLC